MGPVPRGQAKIKEKIKVQSMHIDCLVFATTVFDPWFANKQETNALARNHRLSRNGMAIM